MEGSVTSLSGQDNQSSSEQPVQMPFLFGESSSTIADSRELTARSSEMKANTKAVSLSDRLTPSLISSGLVRGITPMSVRKLLGAEIPATALWPLDGKSADGQRAD